MNATNTWITIGLLTLATVLTRSSFFLVSLRLPEKLQHALRYAPAAAMAAIVMPDLVLGSDGAVSLTWMNPKLMAGIGAALFFISTRRMLSTIMVGMALFTAFRLLM